MANISRNYSYLQTANSRITGLASGMDTESMVEKLMKAESAQMEKLQQQKQTYEWKRDTYRDINKNLSTFKDNIFDKFGLKGSFTSKTVSVSDSNKLSVTAGASATGTLSMQKVDQLASSATKKVSLSLEHFGFTGGPGSSASFRVDGRDVTVSYSKTDTLDQLVEKLKTIEGLENAVIKDGAISLGTDKVEVGSATNFFKKLGFDLGSSPTSTTKVPSQSKEITLNAFGLSSDGTIKLKVIQSDGTLKETAIDYKSTDTLDSFLIKLNNSGAGITALFSKGEISLTANATGKIAGGAMQVTEDSQGLFQKLGFLSSTIGEIANGENAKYIVNGLNMESTSNSFSISGYSITLKEVFDNSATSPITISSSTDIDAMVNKVKEFITTYNELITSLNDKMSEAKYRDFKPLTDAQKNEMTDEQITKWEEKAKSGIIRNDSTVRNALSNLRNVIYQTVEGVDSQYNALYKIGITTTSSYNDGGKMEINDDTKLREALTKDPDSVIKLFTLNDTSDNEKDANHDGNPNTGIGVIAQLRKVADNTVKLIEVTAGKSSSTDQNYTLGKQLININQRIDDWKERLKDIENRYWKQFSAMEDAIQRANSQSAYLMSM